MIPNRFIILIVGIIVISISSCLTIGVYERNEPIPKNKWDYAYQPTFNFNISDTVSEYNLYVVLRHTDAYKYNNIWLNIGTQAPLDTLRTQRFDVLLGDDAKGWEGTGMDDIWEIRRSITNGPFKFKRAGNYKFSIAQVMRENPLPNIMSIGIRVEKVK